MATLTMDYFLGTWTKSEKDRVIEICNIWINGNLTAQEIKDTISLSDDFAALHDGVKPIDNRRALSNVDTRKFISEGYRSSKAWFLPCSNCRILKEISE